VEYRDRESGETRTLRKFYRFKVTSPIHVSLKHVALPGPEESTGALGTSFVEATLRNTASQSIILDTISLEPTASFKVTNLSKPPSTPAPSSKGESKNGAANAADAAGAAGAERGEHGNAGGNAGAPAGTCATLDELCEKAGVSKGACVRVPLSAVESDAGELQSLQDRGDSAFAGVVGAQSLRPEEKQQYLFQVEHSPGDKDATLPTKKASAASASAAEAESSIGRINIVWRSHMGEMGRLQTAAVKREVPTPGDISVTVRPANAKDAEREGRGGGDLEVVPLEAAGGGAWRVCRAGGRMGRGGASI
jgi:hypothetical protein